MWVCDEMTEEMVKCIFDCSVYIARAGTED